jgi:hypothetical protein
MCGTHFFECCLKSTPAHHPCSQKRRLPGDPFPPPPAPLPFDSRPALLFHPTQPQAPKKRVHVFKKFTYRGVDLDKLLSTPKEDLVTLFPSRIRRRFNRGTMTQKHNSLLKRLRKAKKEAKPAPGELHARPALVKVSLFVQGLVQLPGLKRSDEEAPHSHPLPTPPPPPTADAPS